MRCWKILVLLAAGTPLAASGQEPARVESGKPLPDAVKRTDKLDEAFRKGLAAQKQKDATPPRPCAIPLLNVLKPPSFQHVRPDPMIIVPKGPDRFSKNEVQVPAPSCDDLRK